MVVSCLVVVVVKGRVTEMTTDLIHGRGDKAVRGEESLPVAYVGTYGYLEDATVTVISYVFAVAANSGSGL